MPKVHHYQLSRQYYKKENLIRFHCNCWVTWGRTDLYVDGYTCSCLCIDIKHKIKTVFVVVVVVNVYIHRIFDFGVI